ncbi:uncharacterized protein BXIN_0067 [Babesia sp. Xinjiang]|uniref:uncharacterized protein n=1 Tax=Babesia sp. Xinjiang TaxID=462227 RepID=UPI000A25E3EB|nr:uncharacterized protein BXIN_0067 [Babesia sp. Xinjiang]ORM39667.1 hypothetical protein BXIN_0067 [Babesia sp. Xinjiang]
MWSLHLGGKLLDSRVFRRIPFSASSRLEQCPSFESGRLRCLPKEKRCSASSFSPSLDARLRRVQSLPELRQVCFPTTDFPEGAKLSSSQVSAVGQLYALRIIESSGVLRHPLGAGPIEDVDFAECVTWHLLGLLEHYTTNGESSIPRSKHLVGLAWYSMKIASSLATSIESVSKDFVSKSLDKNSLCVLISPESPLSNQYLSRLSLIRRCIEVGKGILSRLGIGSINLNGKDVQQLLMLSCEKVFVKMSSNSESNDQEVRISPDLEHELEEARRAALRSIEGLAEQYAQVMSDSELLSVFVSCCSKDVSPSLVSFLAQSLRDRAASGVLDVSLRDCTAVFNISKAYPVPTEVTSLLMSQLESSCLLAFEESPALRDAATAALSRNTSSGTTSDDTEEVRPLIYKTPFSDIGRFSRSLYHLSCSFTLLRNIDRVLSSTLSSTSFCRRLSSRGRPNSRSLSPGVLTISSIVHLLARNNYRSPESLEKVLVVMPVIPWDVTAQDEMILLADLCWSLLTLEIEAWRLGEFLDKLLSRLDTMPLKHCVKLLGGLYNSMNSASGYRADLDVSATHDRVPMDDLLAYTLNDGCDMATPDVNAIIYPEAFGNLNRDPHRDCVFRYMRSLRALYMSRFNEVEDLQNLSNFMFYVTSILGDLTHVDYTSLCQRWLEISVLRGTTTKVEGLSQVLWSLQKSRIYHEALLLRICDILHEKIDSCSMGQLALMSHTLLTFNMNTPRMMVALLNRVEELADEGSGATGMEVWELKFTSVLWSIVLSDFTLLEDSGIYRLLRLLRRVDWDRFMQVCRHQDLRKILQIQTSIDVELQQSPCYDLPLEYVDVIPNYVISAAIRDTQSVRNSAPLSASQDKARRCFNSLGVRFRCEYEIYYGITVDFALSRNRRSGDFLPDLVVEIDGPHHYNIICGDGNTSYLHGGTLRLLPNGKTEYRNRILRKLGYNVESISWIDAHRRAIHETLHEILHRHHYCFKRR